MATKKKIPARSKNPAKNSPKEKKNNTASDLHSKPGNKKVVTLDRRKGDRREKNVSAAAERRVPERRAKVNRRRQIDPTTCERDYSPEEIEFMNAMDEYKRLSGRMFPTCSEVLEVIHKLGYEKKSAHPLEVTPAPLPIFTETSLPLAAEAVTVF
ncbi:MAG: hypothetical protein JXB10_10125 [Pirellulales bacterium]|nr:hypothetical protein [Pirellulales bacterium]